MIRVVRPAVPPASLTTAGGRQTACDCAAYDAAPESYRTGAKPFAFRALYSRPAVKEALYHAHHQKCAYCESKCPARGTLHVEHFRPKSGVRQSRAQTVDDRPGYYWLAYEWTNLLLACIECNSGYKGTLFPLADPATRARSHADSLADEAPLLVDPASEDPGTHLVFVDDAIQARTARGRATCEAMGLERESLREPRLKVLAYVRMLLDAVQLGGTYPDLDDVQALAEDALLALDAAMQPDAEFSAMVTDFVVEHL
ncbi:hypothetical protein tb265_49940 [Gemmatimonadetes bacterium T265]|nr:hypothetical protein tb265_49940 [Gemmatimonadetes bacterium T265]